jgi:CspA family cold shock protein
MQVGVVKWYDCKKGYGFIVTAEGEDVLAHYSAIEGDGFRRLWDGERVEFEAVRGEKGLNATFVRRIQQDRPGTPRKGRESDEDLDPGIANEVPS